MNTDAIKQLLQDFSFETFLEDLLPELAPLLEKTALLSRLLMLIGPFIILGMGLYYFLNAPKEANFRSGYRCYFGMGSVEAWRFSQRLAGGIWCLVGLGLAIWMACSISVVSRSKSTRSTFRLSKARIMELRILLRSKF